jgi:hypothetical protein
VIDLKFSKGIYLILCCRFLHYKLSMIWRPI